MPSKWQGMLFLEQGCTFTLRGLTSMVGYQRSIMLNQGAQKKRHHNLNEAHFLEVATKHWIWRAWLYPIILSFLGGMVSFLNPWLTLWMIIWKHRLIVGIRFLATSMAWHVISHSKALLPHQRTRLWDIIIFLIFNTYVPLVFWTRIPSSPRMNLYLLFFMQS